MIMRVVFISSVIYLKWVNSQFGYNQVTSYKWLVNFLLVTTRRGAGFNKMKPANW